MPAEVGLPTVAGVQRLTVAAVVAHTGKTQSKSGYDAKMAHCSERKWACSM